MSIIRTRTGKNIARTVPSVLAGTLLSAAFLAPIAAAAPLDRGDADGDGMTNYAEHNYGTNPDRADSDWDGLIDPDEIFKHKTNPNNPDTDGDGLGDWFELDTGSDPLVNGNTPPPDPEPGQGGRPNDRDSDGLFDDDETNVYHTNPDVADTDGDGPDDGQEVYDKTDPLDPNDHL